MLNFYLSLTNRNMATRRNVTGSVNTTGRTPIQYPPEPEFTSNLTSSLIPSASVWTITYSRATAATVQDHEWIVRYAKSGEARFQGARRVENMTAHSKTFTDPTWTKANLLTVTGNAIAWPAGLGMATSLIETATTTQHGIITSTSYANVAGNVYISSFYAKAGARSFVQLLTNWAISLEYANFDLVNGIFSQSSAGVGAMVSVGDGWYRCSIKYTSLSSTTAVVYCMIGVSLADVRYQSYVGDGVSNVYIDAYQHEDVTGQSIKTPSEYVSTNLLSSPFHGANVDGVKYFDTDINGIAIPENTLKGFLNEWTRTNLLLQSDNLAVTWAGTSASVTIDQAISPDGRMTMDKVVPSAANVAHFLSQWITTTANVYAYSIYAKANGYNNIQLWTSGAISNGYVNFNLANGTVWSSSLWTGYIEALPNWVYRCTAITDTLVATTASFAIGLISSPTAIRAEAWLPDGTNGVLVWGTQLELWQNSSSYIPTTTTTVTRNIDVLTYDVKNVIANQWAFSAVFSMDDTAQFDRRALNFSWSTNNRLQFQARRPWFSTAALLYWDGASIQSVLGATLGTNNIAASWTNWVGAYVFMNNTKYSSVAVPNLIFSMVDVGGGSLWYPIFWCVKNVRIWKTPPTDTELLFLSNNP